MAKKQDPAPVKDSRDFVEHPPRGSMQYKDFDGFWFKIRKDLGLDIAVKHQLWTYFKSIGILNEPSKYEAGLKSFGLGN